MKRILLIAVLAITGCTDPTEATSVLKNNGFTDIKIEGYSFTGCSQDDVYHTEFIATGQSGNKVKGVVCGGWLKGSTIRFN